MAKKQNIEIHTEEVMEIMKEIPGRLLRWGLAIIFLIFLSILVGSYFFQFKDIVSAPVVITTSNPPANIISKSTGRINTWFVIDGEDVSKGQKVALIQNQASLNDIYILDSIIYSIETISQDYHLIDLNLPNKLTLGELQDLYVQLQRNWMSYTNYIESDFIPRKIELLQIQIDKQKQQYRLMLEQQKILEKELEVVRNNFSRHQSILNKGGVSESQIEEAQVRVLAAERGYSAFLSSVKSAEINLINQERSLLELNEQHRQDLISFKTYIKENIKTLQKSSKDWKEKYLLCSPIDGKLTLTKFWSENHIINSGERLATIVPFDKSEIICRAVVSSTGISKVSAGQKVHIKLAGYPFMEYGMLTGSVHSVSLVPEQEGYLIEIGLEHGMVSTYQNQLKLIQEMDGTAEIIAEEMRMIYRFINPLKMLFNK